MQIKVFSSVLNIVIPFCFHFSCLFSNLKCWLSGKNGLTFPWRHVPPPGGRETQMFGSFDSVLYQEDIFL